MPNIHDDPAALKAIQDELDMACIEHWCDLHGTRERLRRALAEIPPPD